MVSKYKTAPLLIAVFVASGLSACRNPVRLTQLKVQDSYTDNCPEYKKDLYFTFKKHPSNVVIYNPSGMFVANGKRFPMTRVTNDSGPLNSFGRIIEVDNDSANDIDNIGGKLRFRYVMKYWLYLPFPWGSSRFVRSEIFERPFGSLDWTSDNELDLPNELIEQSDDFLSHTGPDRWIWSREAMPQLPSERLHTRSVQLTLKNRLTSHTVNINSLHFLRRDGTPDSDMSSTFPATGVTLSAGGAQTFTVTYSRTINDVSQQYMFHGNIIVSYTPKVPGACKAEMLIPTDIGFFSAP